MTNVFSKKYNKNYAIFFIIVLFFIVGVYLLKYFTLIEGFSLSASSSDPNIPAEYKYLKPVPKNTVWSTDTQTQFVAKFNSNLAAGATQVGPEILTSFQGITGSIYGSNIGYMNGGYVTEEEAKYYIANGKFPYDDYIINYGTKVQSPPSTQSDLDNSAKQFSNRMMYYIISLSTVPLGQFLSLAGSNTPGANSVNGTSWNCQQGNLNILPPDGKQWEISTDYSILSSVPGLSFDSQPCNICEFTKYTSYINSDQTANNDYVPNIYDAYNNPNNTCKFKVAGDVPEAFNIYMGDYSGLSASQGSSSTVAQGASSVAHSETTTSSKSSDAYKQCVTSCNT